MKIELSDNKVFFENQGSKKEIHPFWLRERVNGVDLLIKVPNKDCLIQQRSIKILK